MRRDRFRPLYAEFGQRLRRQILDPGQRRQLSIIALLPANLAMPVMVTSMPSNKDFSTSVD